jgi:hypothetical protein
MHRIHTHTHRHRHTHIRKHTQTRNYTHTQTHTHARTHTHKRTRAHTHTRTRSNVRGTMVSQPTFDRNEEGRWSREGCAGAMWAAGSAWSDATQPGPLGEGRALFSGSSTTTTPARPIAEGLQRNGTAASPRSVWRSSGASSPVVKGELSRDEGSSESGSESRSALVSSPFAGGGGR